MCFAEADAKTEFGTGDVPSAMTRGDRVGEGSAEQRRKLYRIAGLNAPHPHPHPGGATRPPGKGPWAAHVHVGPEGHSQEPRSVSRCHHESEASASPPHPFLPPTLPYPHEPTVLLRVLLCATCLASIPRRDTAFISDLFCNGLSEGTSCLNALSMLIPANLI